MLATSTPQSGLAYWARRVLEECDKARQGFAPDPVHDLRVAIRRCRSMADGLLSVDPDPKWKQIKKLVKPLFSGLGQLRDTQVMMEWVVRLSVEGDAVRESLLALLRKEEEQEKCVALEALQAFDRKRWAALNAHLAERMSRVPLEGLVFQHLALERWLEARELHRRALRNRTQTAYHQLRIGIKRFRYTLENFLPQRHAKWAKDLRELQDALGEVHDLDVLRGILRMRPGISAADRVRWEETIQGERQKRLDLYRGRMLGRHSLWQVWRAELPSGALLEKAAMEKLRTWASFLDPHVGHSERVTKIALQLYDQLAALGVLASMPDQRRILQAAAILHEVGRREGARGHRKRAFRRISRLAPPLGWNADQMRCVAAVARLHSGRLPQNGTSYFVGCGKRRLSEMLAVAGILRLADALASREGPRGGMSLERRDGTVILHSQELQQMGPLAEKISRARYLLEASCRHAVLVQGRLMRTAKPIKKRTPSPAPAQD